MLSAFAVLMLLAPSAVLASRLISATVGSRDRNSSLVVLQFDTPITLNLQSSNGREYLLGGGTVEPRTPVAQNRGLVRSITVVDGRIRIETTRYTHARLTSAGTGTWLLVLEPTKEPPAPKPVETQQPAATQQTTRQTEEPQQQASRPVQEPATQSPEVTPEPSSQTRDIEQEYVPAPSMPATMGQAPMDPSGSHFLDLFEFVPIESVQLPPTVKFALEISQQGNRDRAIVLLESIRPDEPEYGWAQISLGRLMDQAGDVSSALDHYRLALPIRETEGVAAVRIALAFQALNNRDAAAAMWERVLDMNQGQVFVEPAEMPRAPIRRAPNQFAGRRAQDDQSTQMAQGMDDGGDVQPEDSTGVRPRTGTSMTARFMRILSFWPYAVGGIALIAGLYFGLSYVQKKYRANAEMFDLNKDLESMGLDAEVTESSRADSASPRVAQMYADQQGEAPTDDGDAMVGSPDNIDDGPGELDIEPDASVDIDDDLDDSISLDDDDSDELALSEIKKAKIREMHAEGSSVREIAESLGLGQDEVRMTIDLAEST